MKVTKLLAIFCVLKSVLANYENNETKSVVSYPSYKNSVVGRQFSDDTRYSVNSVNGLASHRYKSKPGSLVKTGRIKMGLMKNVPIMNADEHYPVYARSDDKPIYDSLPMMVYGSGPFNEFRSQHNEMPSPSIFEHHNNMMQELEAKEAALKGFGIGLALGLGALGSLSGLLKFLLIPLLGLGALFPLLLLLLNAPIPIITTGKLLRSYSPKINEGSQKDTTLQEAIEEVIKKLPAVMKSQVQKKIQNASSSRTLKP